MPIVVGTDEAGYGPNLGPLVITATTWRLPDNLAPHDMWTALESVVTDKRSRSDTRLHIADSKQVYSAQSSIAALETGVQAFLQQLAVPADTLSVLGTALSGNAFTENDLAVRGGIVDDLALPVAAKRELCTRHAEQLSQVMASSDIRLLDVRSAILYPDRFNRATKQLASKGKVLSGETLRLVRQAVDLPQCDEQGWVICDKHGGRNRYDDVIADAFDDRLAFCVEESRSCSTYRLGNLEFQFRTRAEELLPVALSSMVSKYLRELTMTQFNRFWQHHLPELKPTKGYPVDAKRFWAEIESTVAELGLSREHIWRNR